MLFFSKRQRYKNILVFETVTLYYIGQTLEKNLNLFFANCFLRIG